MRNVVIYDNTGHMILISSGEDAREPQGGVQYLTVDVPDGKMITGIDVSTTPHKVILEDIPPSEIDLLKIQVAEQEKAILELTMALASIQGGGSQ